MNLSLGSPAGFTYRSDLLSTMEVYDRLAKAGIIVAAAAGNEYSAAYKNLWGTDLSLTSNPDYGIVGSPSSYSQTLSVASADNVTIRSAYFEAAGRQDHVHGYGHDEQPRGRLHPRARRQDA